MGGGGFIGGLVDTIANVSTMGAYGQHKSQKEAQKAQEEAQRRAAEIQRQQAEVQKQATAQQQAIQQQQVEMAKQQQLQTERQQQYSNKLNAGTAISNRVNSNDYNRADLTKGNASTGTIGKGQLEDLQDDEDWY